jgi:hypothetical protein
VFVLQESVDEMAADKSSPTRYHDFLSAQRHERQYRPGAR